MLCRGDQYKTTKQYSSILLFLVSFFDIGNESMKKAEFKEVLVAMKDYGLTGCQVIQLTSFGLDESDLTREKIIVM